MRIARLLLVDLVLPLLLGGLLVLGHEQWFGYLVAVPTLALMASLWRRVGLARAAWRGWLMGAAYHGLLWLRLDAWLTEPWSGVVAAAVPVVGGACAMALAGAIAGAMRRWSPLPWALLIVPAGWILGELLLGLSSRSVPVSAIGHMALDMPLTGLVPLLGPQGLSWLLLLLAGLLWLLFCALLFERLLALLLIAGLPVLVWLLPMPGHWITPSGRNLQVAVRSVAAHDSAYWQSAIQGRLLSSWLGLLGRDNAELVIWPDRLPLGRGRAAGRILESLDEAARLQGRALLVHLPRESMAASTPRLPFRMLGKGAGSLSIPGEDERGSLVTATGVSIVITAAQHGRPWQRTASIPASAQVLFHFDRQSDRMRRSSAPLRLSRQRMHALMIGRALLSIGGDGHGRLIDPEGRVRYGFHSGGAWRFSGGVALYHGQTPYQHHGNTPLWYASIAIILGALLGAGLLRRRAGSAFERVECADPGWH